MTGLLLSPMRARDATQEHRASTPLELFFDLTFVVAVSFAAQGLATQIESGETAHGSSIFVEVFFAIWWGWLNFTWFASAYDTDDWLYRVVTLFQMGGALTVAAGIPGVYDRQNFTVVVVGYVIMRLAMVFQWLRAARDDPPRRATALRYAAGVSIMQTLWIARLALPLGLALASFVALVLGELAVPALAERHERTTYHRAHITERYGLFTIIVLGEGVLAAGNSVISALQDSEHVGSLVVLAVGGLALLAGMWWLYFSTESIETLHSPASSFVWGYGHFGIFAAAAAVSSGIEVQVAVIERTHEAGAVGEVGELAARLAVAGPAAAFVLLVWALVIRPVLGRGGDVACAVGIVLVVVVALMPVPVGWATVLDAVVLTAVVALVTRLQGHGEVAP